MKLKHLLALASLVIGGGNLCAQTDVTSTYITNADFEGEYSSYAQPKSDRDIYQPTGWTITYSNGEANDITSLNSSCTQWNQFSSKAQPTNGGNNTYWIRFRWGNSESLQLSQTVTLPAGQYTLSADAFFNGASNATAVILAGNQTTKITTANAWVNYTIDLVLTETKSVTLGFKLTQGSQQESIAAFDNFTLTYTAVVIKDVLEAALTAANNANASLGTLGDAIATAQAVYDDDDATQDEVNAAAATLNAAVELAMSAASDVSFLIPNLGFEDCTETATNAAAASSAAPLDIAGDWTQVGSAAWSSSAVVSYGGSGQVNGASAPATDNAGNTGKTLGVSVGWDGTVTYKSKAATLPAGVYTLRVNAYNASTDAQQFASKFGFVPTSGTATLSTKNSFASSTWVTDEVTFTLNEATEGAIQVGGTAVSGGSGSNAKVFFDNITIGYQSFLASAKAAWDEAKAAAEAAISNSDYANVTGSEKTALQTEIDKAEPTTVDGYEEAVAALTSATGAFTEATPKYDAFEAEKASAIAIGVTSEAANAVVMNTADGLQDALNALYVLEDAASTANYAVDATTLFGTWTAQNMDTKSGEHWSGDASRTYYDRWQNSGYTASITSTMTLPAGKYVFKVAARAQEGGINGAFNMSVKVGDAAAVQKDFVAKSATGYGIETSGVANYSEGGTYANTTGRGWEWRFIGFELSEETSVTMTAYAQILANHWVGFSDATLLTTSDNVAILKNLLSAELTTANTINTTVNVGDGVFQTPTSAANTFGDAKATAQTVYDNASATSAEVSQAIADLQAAEVAYKAALNAPAANTKYYIKVATTGHAKLDNALLLTTGTVGDNNPTGYTLNANNAPAEYLSQAFTFTQVSGNTYNISIDLDGTTVYLTNGTNNGSAAGWKASQIQGTTDDSKAMAFKIEAADVANTFYIYNTETNSTVACQTGGNIYTESGNAYFAVAEATEASVELTVAAGKLATRIFPFTPTLPEGVEAYSCAAHEGASLTFTKVDAPAANTPYILYSENGCESTNLTGWGTAAADTYTDDYLTGVFARTEVPQGSYVLQTQSGKQAFYIVNQAGAYSSANRAYVTVPASGEVKAFGFTLDDVETAIEAARAEGAHEVTLRYNAAGQQMNGARKGLNIVKMADGTVRKVLVK